MTWEECQIFVGVCLIVFFLVMIYVTVATFPGDMMTADNWETARMLAEAGKMVVYEDASEDDRLLVLMCDTDVEYSGQIRFDLREFLPTTETLGHRYNGRHWVMGEVVTSSDDRRTEWAGYGW